MKTKEIVDRAIYKFLGRDITLKNKISVFKSKLDFLEFLSYLEEIANIKFDPEEVKKFKTLEDVYTYILQKMI
jgi:acyl carrier protein